MVAYAELEIGLHRQDSERYAVELRFSRSDSEADLPSERGFAHFDLEELRAQTADAGAYGKLLVDSLFAQPDVRATFEKARVSAQSAELPLRIRLVIGPSAPELHSLRWETLRDPQQADASLLTNESILFSRYLNSLDWRPVHQRPKGDLRALVIIANPAELLEGKYSRDGRQLAPIDVPGELERAKHGLGSIPVKALTSGGTATLDQMISQLHDGYDILYLVAHGALVEGQPKLLLENQEGQAAVVPGSEVVTRLGELEPQERPRLVVLASCQSAGTGEEATSSDKGMLAALGPRLAEAGIPAVLAMQGDVLMSTMAEFMPVFFRELQRDGQLDRAMAVARGAVRDRLDYWMPVLFMRLKSGRIWYVPGFDKDQKDFDKWPALLGNIYDGYCTPILGFGIHEPTLGTSQDLAQRWADLYHFPMAVHEREDLPQVAQYLAVHQQEPFPIRELVQYLRRELLRRYRDKLPDEVRQPGVSAQQVMAAVGEYLRESESMEPHKVLANLPFPIYITTNPDNSLAEALIAAGKKPQVELCRWNEEARWPRSIYEDNPDYEPTINEPLVYHLFGHIKLLESMVVKEDDYFDYLIGVTSNKQSIPSRVRRALTDSALLFLGFRIDDWDFRALFRSLISQEGGSRRLNYTHVAAQINPDEGRNLDPEGARRYLQSYFQESAISIYWGNVADFLKDLQPHWEVYVREQGGD